MYKIKKDNILKKTLEGLILALQRVIFSGEDRVGLFSRTEEVSDAQAHC